MGEGLRVRIGIKQDWLIPGLPQFCLKTVTYYRLRLKQRKHISQCRKLGAFKTSQTNQKEHDMVGAFLFLASYALIAKTFIFFIGRSPQTPPTKPVV
jgi:hypothetical protein